MMYFTSVTFKKAAQAGVLFTRAFVDLEEVTTFISHVLPLMLCYFIMAVLAITPQTCTLRIALFPAMVLLALRATLLMDMSLKNTERKFHRYLAPWIFVTTTHVLSWVLAKKAPREATPFCEQYAVNPHGCP
ncbi:hypothetical protein OG21DRAFT_1500504 [Imleria badia]|nr:hypothetical protein OG21DRAFT_1500504 [Imleria badia]